MASLQHTTRDRLSAGNGSTSQPGTVQRHDVKPSLLGNFTSEASSDYPGERGRAGKSLLLQSRRKGKRVLESHRRVKENFLSSASFRCSWEGPLSCLSPKGCATQCQGKKNMQRPLAARTENKTYLSKDLEVPGGRRQWEPHAEEHLSSPEYPNQTEKVFCLNEMLLKKNYIRHTAPHSAFLKPTTLFLQFIFKK